MSAKLTKNERNWGLDQFNELIRLIDDGKLVYSKSKLSSDFNAYRMHTWFQVNPFLSGLIAIVCFMFAVIPLIFLFLALFLSKAGRERYEEMLLKLKHGRLKETQD